MKGDYTRSTFVPEKHFSGVRMQQGRAQLDSDWNEWVDIQNHLNRLEERDLIGLSGAPVVEGGFEIGMLPSGNDLLPSGNDLAISPGRIYVDGMLCQLEGSAIPCTVADSGRVSVASLLLDRRPFEPGQWVEISGKDADDGDVSRQCRVTRVQFADRMVSLEFGGNLREISSPQLKRITTYLTQPDSGRRQVGMGIIGFPQSSDGIVEVSTLRAGQQDIAVKLPMVISAELVGARMVVVTAVDSGNKHVTFDRDVGEFRDAAGLRLSFLPTMDIGPGSYFAYLDVWQRHITALEDPEIREVALGGPDTATRTKTVWQVKLLQIAEASNLLCGSERAEWNSRVQPPSGQLTARAEPSQASDDPCVPSGHAGYQQLENQLYRVEIHAGGALGTATFKWSRDNGSIATRLMDINENLIIISEMGRNIHVRFASGQWIELSDDARVLRGEPGVLVRLKNAEGTMLFVDPNSWPGNAALTMEDLGSNPVVRLWDMVDGALTTTDTFQRLRKDGIEVKFDPGEYRTGDYWLIPARKVQGDIQWPVDESGPVPSPPHGTRHHYCRLGLLESNQTGLEIKGDCRRLFPAATELTQLHYIDGDGQEVMPRPQPTLPRPLQVGVSNGHWPVEGAQVVFTILSPSEATTEDPPLPEKWGFLTGAGPPGSSIVVPTTAEGIAECTWRLARELPTAETQDPEGTYTQQVEARLLDDAGAPLGLPVRFNANLSIAKEVAYEPKDVPWASPVEDPPTVKKALDQLRDNVTLEFVSGDGQEARPGVQLPRPLQVRVANNNWPVQNADVRFRITDPATGGNGRLKKGPAASSSKALGHTVKTDVDGIAQIYWIPDTEQWSQQVEATLTRVPKIGTPPFEFDRAPIRFNANLSIAREVHYDDRENVTLPTAPAGPPTAPEAWDAQQALDQLRKNIALRYVGGDGQSVQPGGMLPQPLQVRVANGQWPKKGARVRFQIERGHGTLGTSPGGGEGDGASALIVYTNEEGLANCWWRLGTGEESQRVSAVLLAPKEDAAAPDVEITGPVFFNATASAGAGVSRRIHQAGHGFRVGQAIHFDGENYALATSDSGATTGMFIVAEVYNEDNFLLLLAGYIERLGAPGALENFLVSGETELVPGEYYFVSADEPGRLTRSEPPGISNPILYVDVSGGEVGGYVLPYRPAESSPELLKEYIDELLVGSISAFAMPEPPEGWLECNGHQVSRAKYARLFNKIGKMLAFTIGTEFAAELDKQTISDNLRKVFDNNGRSLGIFSTVIVNEPGNDWTIFVRIDRAFNFKWYLVKLAGNRLEISETIYGDGDTVTTFNLPDLRGEFIRGWDSERNVDPGRLFGTGQLDALQKHRHNELEPGHLHQYWDIFFSEIASAYSNWTAREPVPAGFGSKGYDWDNVGYQMSRNTGLRRVALSDPVSAQDDAAIPVRASNETRPRNVALMYCIKY